MQDLTSSVTWASSSPSTAIVGIGGLATGQNPGTTTISATSGAISGSTSLAVTNATLTGIAVTPANVSIAKGTTQQYTATGTFTDGGHQDLTSSVTWNVALGTSATISNTASSHGLATGIGIGSTTFTASMTGLTGNSATLTVTAATLQSVAITPAAPVIAKGTTKQFTATGTFTDGSTQDLTGSASWSSSAPGVASIGGGGLATGINPGATTVTALSGSISGSTTLTVTNATLTGIAITPTNQSIEKGTDQQFLALGTFTDGSQQDLTSSATWASSDPVKARISNVAGTHGLATGLSAGTAIISANSGAVTSNTATLTVNDNVAAAYAFTTLPNAVPAGASQGFTVTVLDAAGHTATGYTGTIHVTSGDSQATLPGNYAFVAGDGGAHTFAVTFRSLGDQILTATDTASPSITGSQHVTVVAAGATTLTVSGYHSPAVAGTSGNVTIVAKSGNGDIATGYRSTIRFTSTDPQAELPTDYTFGGPDQGVHSFAVTFKTAGTQSITVTDSASGGITGSQSGIAVASAPASRLVLVAPATAPAGSTLSLTVTARDAFGNIAIGYPGTVRFASTDTKATLPSTYTFAPTDSGTHAFPASFKTAGGQSVTVTDVTSSAITATANITIAGPDITEIRPISGPIAGGATVTITGSGLAGATVAFDGAAATNVRVNADGTSLTCVTPAHSVGATVDVTVTTNTGTATANHAYTYLPSGGVSPLPNSRPSSGSSNGPSGIPPAVAPASR